MSTLQDTLGVTLSAVESWFKSAVLPRLEVVILGLLFWIVFGLGTVITLAGQLVGIGAYALFGYEAARDWVYSTGKGTDGINNAAWFGGNAKETISSHTGRWIVSALASNGQLKVPLKFRFVNWLTGLFETDHCVKAIEAPFIGQPS